MSLYSDARKVDDMEDKNTTGTASTYAASSEQDLRTAESEKPIVGAVGVPDLGHEEIEEMDADHEKDLERQLTSESIRAGSKSLSRPRVPRTQTNKSSTGSAKSTRSRVSRIASNATGRARKRERLQPERIPESDLSKGIVGWESQSDPEMPLNFPDGRKWLLLGLISSITFLAPLASSMFAPGVSFMNEDFHNNNEILSALTVSIFVLGFAVGPLFLSPLSEIYGRRFVLLAGNVFFTLWQIGCALAPNLSSLIVFRFLAGVGGSGCLTIGGGVIADMFRADQRGLATSMYSLGPLFGPIIGPIAGGFIAERIGWRWVFWVLLIATGLTTFGIECLNRETNHRVLMKRKIILLSQQLNRTDLVSCYETSGPTHSSQTIIRNGMLRPLKMLFLSPIVFLLSLYMAMVYGLLYLFFTTITQVFHVTYGWRPELTGLAYLGIGLGFMSGLIAVAKMSDKTVVRMTKANDGVFEPEMRLPACVFFACFVPISFFWYGWSAYYKVHWIVPIIGLFPFGFGMMGIFIPIQTYLIDSFPTFAASAVAALTVSRSLFGAILPLAGPSLFESLGLGWGNSLLGFIAIALIPAPLGIYKYGGRIRKAYPIKL